MCTLYYTCILYVLQVSLHTISTYTWYKSFITTYTYLQLRDWLLTWWPSFRSYLMLLHIHHQKKYLLQYYMLQTLWWVYSSTSFGTIHTINIYVIYVFGKSHTIHILYYIALRFWVLMMFLSLLARTKYTYVKT